MNTNFALVALCAVTVSGCTTVGPDYVEPAPTPATTAPAVLPSAKAAQPKDSAQSDIPDLNVGVTQDEPPAQWWKQLNDDNLDELIAAALDANFDLRVAEANVKASRTEITQAEAQGKPAGSVSASTERSDSGAAGGATTPTNVSLGASWELDLFGRVTRLSEAALANVQYTEELRNDTAISVIAQVANAYLNLLGAEHQIEVAKENIQSQEKSLELTRQLFDAGSGNRLDVVNAEQQLRSTQASIPLLNTQVTSSLNRLTTLTAKPIGSLTESLGGGDIPLPRIPDFVAIGEPADILRRRPDIRAAERTLAAATAQIGVNTADLFPRVTFNAALSASAATPSGLGSGATGVSIGPSISWNFLNRDATRARIAKAGAEAEAALARYEKSVVTALEETDTALARYLNERSRLVQLTEAARAAREAASLAKQRFDAGAANFLEVLTADRSLLSAEDAAAQSKTAIANDLVGVYLALGGGWQVSS